MEFDRVVDQTHAVRAFSHKQVPDETLCAIVEEAVNAPTWMNAQERKIYIATGDKAAAIRKEYAELGAANTPDRGAYKMGHHSDWSEAAQQNMAHFQDVAARTVGDDGSLLGRAENELFDAPAFALLALPPKPAPWGILDLGALEEAIVLCAANKGVSSIVAYAFIKYPDVLRKYLPIPEDQEVVIGIGLGYPDPDSPLNKIHAGRVPLDDVLTIN
ncbi:MAG: hypothetical protein HDQ87_09325 [Clostridia bacterium]|nr:hypothetical protein [Clostridia bacterium]